MTPRRRDAPQRSPVADRLAPRAGHLALDDDSAEHAGHAGAAGGGGHFSLLIVSEQFAGLTAPRPPPRGARPGRRPDPPSGARACHPRLHPGRILPPDERTYAMTRTTIALAVLAALAVAGTAQAQPAAPKAAGARRGRRRRRPERRQGAVPAVAVRLHAEGAHSRRGSRTRPSSRNAIREELNTRELLVREAKKENLDKNTGHQDADGPRRRRPCWSAPTSPTGSRRTRFPRPTCARNTTPSSRRWATRNTRSSTSWSRRRTRPRTSIAAAAEGRRSSTTSRRRARRTRARKDRGGDLDWNAPGGFVKPFGDAMVATPKGKFTAQPVQTQFG